MQCRAHEHTFAKKYSRTFGRYFFWQNELKQRGVVIIGFYCIFMCVTAFCDVTMEERARELIEKP